ncbi:MAG: YihY/virulence factor BrkB family protein [Chloroflexota bacterium]|nr:YihY/virulence factor BrkB family protein [Chloroflexota bacterium]
MSVPEENWVSQRWQQWRSESWERLQDLFHNWNRQTGGLFTLLGDTWRAFSDDDGGTHAAAIGYYALFSLFPIVVLLSLSLTVFLGETRARIQVLYIVGRYLPTRLQVVDEIVQNVIANRGTLSALAILGIIWGSMHIFRVLERSINQAWGAPERRNFWRHFLFSIVMITITGILTTISLALTTLFRFARPLNLPVIQWAPLENPLLWALVSALPPFLLVAALFMLLYRYVPHAVHVRWREVVPSALVAAGLWEIAKHAFAFYLSNFAQQNYSLLYGSLGAIIGLLTWVYVTGYIILMGAELCAVLSRHHDEQREGLVDRAAGSGQRDGQVHYG